MRLHGMKSDAIPLAIEHNRAEAERCDRMLLCKYPAPVLLDMREGFVETTVRVQVN